MKLLALLPLGAAWFLLPAHAQGRNTAADDSAATTTINARSGRQNQPSQMAAGAEPTRMAFS